MPVTRRPRDDRTLDLFVDVYPVRRPHDVKAGAFASDYWLRRAMAEAVKECGRSREEIAAEMAVSVHMLNRYTAESADQAISVMRFLSFVRTTGATWLLDEVAKPFGCYVVEGEEALLAERGLVLQQIDELRARERQLARMKPARILRRRT